MQKPEDHSNHAELSRLAGMRLLFCARALPGAVFSVVGTHVPWEEPHDRDHEQMRIRYIGPPQRPERGRSCAGNRTGRTRQEADVENTGRLSIHALRDLLRSNSERRGPRTGAFPFFDSCEERLTPFQSIHVAHTHTILLYDTICILYTYM